MTSRRGATHQPSGTRQSRSNTSVAAAGRTVLRTPSCGIMKMLSTASSQKPSGWKASSIISAASARRGAWDSTPPEPMIRLRLIMSTSEVSLP